MTCIRLTAAILAIAAALPLVAAKKPKQPKPPTQPPINAAGCVTVLSIYSHKLGILSGIAAPEPGLDAVIRNDCPTTMSIFLDIGYFDSRGTQFGNGLASATVAAHGRFDLHHDAYFAYPGDRGRLKLAKILTVRAFPQ